jgi:hypothetical protein
MSKHAFGHWADTDDTTFAAALAAIGVAAAVAPDRLSGTADDLSAWWTEYLTTRPVDTSYPWRSPLGAPGWDTVPAQTWASLWQRRPFGWSRFSVDRDLGQIDAVWLQRILKGPGGEAALHFATEPAAGPVGLWRLPLRFGLIDAAGGAEVGRAFAAAAADRTWMNTLAAARDFDAANVSADIVLAAGEPGEIEAAFRGMRESRTDALVVLHTNPTLASAVQLQGGLELPFVALVSDPVDADWIVRFITEVSHNAPLDVAISSASLQDSIVVGPSVFMSEQRPARRAAAVAETLRGIEPADTTRGADPPTMARDFEAAADAEFLRETGNATSLATMEHRAAPIVAEASAARWLQARIGAASDPQRPLPQFRPGTDHVIRVRIAPADTDWLEAATPFPDDQLPADRPNRLTIVLTEPSLLDVPLVDELVLPVIGPSTECVFSLTTREDTTSVDARLIVLNRNRVLQTARLPEHVAAEPEAVGRGLHRIPDGVATPETVVRGAGGNLGDRRTFDAAVVVDHDAAAATAVAGGRAATVDLDDSSLTEALDKLTGRLGEIVDQPEDFDSLTADGTRELLVFLAHHGALLRRALVKDFLGEALGAASYLQVVSARPDAYFPFELAYDFPAPGEDATLCPEASDALANPDVTAVCPGNHDGSTVCPFGFWAISKVIERHAFQPGDDVPRSFLVRSQPTRDRETISLGGESLVAVSDRVDNFTAGSVEQLADAIAAVAGSVARPVTWKDWRDEVAAASPALLVLLPHTVHSDALDTFGLEIGSGDRAWAGDIDDRFLPPEGHPVIVALLGCDTAGAGQIGYERFPGILRRAGAEVVVATLTEVLGRHAAPVGARLAEALYACCDDRPRSVGEVMVGLRRRLLHDGVIMVLALAVFGDADWLLARGA